MAHLDDVIKRGDIYICEDCKKEFPAEEIKFEDPIDGFELLTPMMPFIYLNKDMKIMGGSKFPQKELGDKVLCCPHCGTTHLFGFDLKK